MALKDAYLNLVTSQHRNKPKFMATVEKLLDPLDGILSAATFFDDAFDLDDAQGCQQDLLGEVIGQSRALEFRYEKDISSILDDEAYRVIQKAKIIRNLWDGELGDLYEKWLTLFGAPIRVQDNQDMTMSVLLDITENNELQKLMKLTAHGLIVPKPMGVKINYEFWYPPISLPVIALQAAQILQLVDAHHCPWNLGVAQTTRWDNTYAFDSAVRWDGIYGADYREQQRHVIGLWYTVEAVQRNLVLVNVWDGSFAFVGEHTWSGSPLQRLPLHKSAVSGKVALQHRRAVKLDNRIFALNCPDVYLLNPVSYTSANLQAAIAPQALKPRQISDALGTAATSHRQQWCFGAAALLQADSPQRLAAEQSGRSAQREATAQRISTRQQSAARGQSAAQQTEAARHGSAQTAKEVSCEQIGVGCAGSGMNLGVVRRSTDYRTVNLHGGSFRMDGTHAFEGAKQQDYARATHRCSIARLYKNEIGRIEWT